MHYFPRLSILSVLAAATLSDLAASLAPPWDEVVLKHTSDTVPVDWVTLGDPPAGTTIDLHFSLKPYQENALIDALNEVSNPMHRKYGAHLSKEQVAELVAPHPHALELVTSWLDYYGVPSSSISMTHGGGWLTATDVPMSQANELLGASYQLYRHARTNDTTILRTISYGLPAMLHKHVETVVPTTCFASVRTLRKTPRRRSVEVRQSATSAESGSGVGSAIVGSGSPGVGSTGSSNGCGGDKARRKVMALSRHDHMDMPASLHWLYNYVPTPDQTTLGVASYLDEYPSQADLRMYMNYREDAVAATVRIDGGEYDSSHPDLDAETDNEIDYTEAMAYLTSHVYYSTGGLMRWSPSSNEPGVGDLFLDWLNYILSQTTIPQTISVSYGLLETDLPLEYTTSVCNLFAQLGARGISVLFSSGDNGIGAGDRKDSSGTMRFIPEFPATCPYVTSVGGTTNQLPEAVASLSGGGFSSHFPRPSYQNDVVTTFFQNLSDNTAGRGVPDVSAQAQRYRFIFGDDTVPESGTSYAVLTVAGIISLLNDHLISNGEPPLGFLNPWLYSNGLAGLNHTSSCSNPGCSADGFSAIAGWDPVTGLGTPNIVKLQRVLDNRSLHTEHKPFDDKKKDKWFSDQFLDTRDTHPQDEQ